MNTFNANLMRRQLDAGNKRTAQLTSISATGLFAIQGQVKNIHLVCAECGSQLWAKIIRLKTFANSNKLAALGA